MLRLGLYGSPERTAPLALAAGAVRLGYLPQWREGSRFVEDQVEHFDLVVVDGGLRGPLGRVARSYAAVQVPVLVLDLGYLDRARYSQLSLGGLNRVPPVEWFHVKPGGETAVDRFASLGIEMAPGGPPGEEILICGQMPEDSAHGMDRSELEAWISQTVRRIRMNTRARLVYRPHPLDGGWQNITGVDAIVSPMLEDLPTCLHRAAAVVTVNSNVGHEALLAGVPVFYQYGSRAAYAELAETDLSKVAQPKLPSLERRLEYFRRLAYGQWTAAELETGEPLAFLAQRGLIPEECV